MLTPKNITNKIEDLQTLIENISSEIEAIEYDFENLDSDQQKQVPKDLNKIESHLRKTATLFSHLNGNNIPDWRN